MVDLPSLFELDALAVDSVSQVPMRRFAWHTLSETPGRPFVALFGPRGAGKTVLMRQLRAEMPRALYISADALEGTGDLFEIASRLHRDYGIENLCLDEIHFVPNYAEQLKRIYDFLPLRLWFTSSVALSLTATGWDLSRRVVRMTLPPFSYREYLRFTEGIAVAPLRLRECLLGSVPPEYLRLRGRFRSYVEGGLYPFVLESGLQYQLFEHVLEKVVTHDIPGFDPELTQADIEGLRKTVRFIGRSAVDGINYSTVSKHIGVTKYKAEKYLAYLERSFIARRIFPAGTRVTKEPKVLLQLPYRLLYQSYDDAVGALREEFTVCAVEQHQVPMRYAKSTRGAKTPDYLIDLDGTPVVVEVGGPGKGRSQFKEVDYEQKVIVHDGEPSPVGSSGVRRVPLHVLGFA
mgnify:FL=1